MSGSSHVTLALLEQIIAAFNAKDLDAIAGFFAEDGEMLLAAGSEPCGTRLQGREAIRAGLAQRFAAVPDIRWVDGRNWVFGDRALSEWRVKGTLASGDRLDCLGCDLWRFRDGKILSKDTYYKQVKT